jgi:hypothetical protein
MVDVMAGCGYIFVEWILFWFIYNGRPLLYYLADWICKNMCPHYVMETTQKLDVETK